MIRFLEVTQAYHGSTPELVNLDNVIGIRKADSGTYATLDLRDGTCKHIRMDYESLKAYLGGMILGA